MMPRTQPLHRLAAMGLLMAMIAIPAYANFIGFPAIFYMGGPWKFVPFALIWTLGETLVIGILTKVSFKRVIWPVFLANLVSFIAGIPVSILNDGVYFSFLSLDYIGRIVWYTKLVVILVAIFLVVSVLIEFPLVSRRIRKLDPAPSRKHVFGAVAAANVLTYCIIGYWFYYETRPLERIGPLLPNTAWASDPPARIYYVYPEQWGRLYTVLSTGEDRRLLVNDYVTDYLITGGSEIVLYKTGANELKIQYPHADAPVEVGVMKDGLLAYGAACNSDGSSVVFATDSKFGTLEIVDVASGMRSYLEVDDRGNRKSLMWSTDPAIFFFVQDGVPTAYRIAEGPAAIEVPYEAGSMAVAEAYCQDGFLYYSDWKWDDMITGPLPTSATRMPVGNFFRDHGRESRISTVCVVGGGHEILFSDWHGIYLMRLEDRALAKLAAGVNWSAVADGYRKRISDARRRTDQ